MKETTILFQDIIISGLYITIILLIGLYFKSNKKEKPYKEVLMPFIFFKIVCSILFVVIHIFVYRGGDTFLYYNGSRFFVEQIIHSPQNTFLYLFGDIQNFTDIRAGNNLYLLHSIREPSTLLQSKIVAFFTLFGFKNYLATSILYSFFCAIGHWQMYIVFCRIYPKLYKWFAAGVLFIPTVGLWSSGILKDPLVLSSIGYIVYGFYNLGKRRNFIFSALVIIISTYLCFRLKPYILYAFMPPMILWLYSKISSTFKSSIIKIIFRPIILIIFVLAGYFFLQTISSGAGKYSLENVEEVASGFQNWHTYLAETRNQSGYSLGEFEFTFFGLLRKAPEALFVTYFRPLPFEISNVPMALGSFEATSLLIITLMIVFKRGGITFIRVLIFNKDVRSFMLFAIILGLAVGFTSYNFGALSRYRIPCMPFFWASLTIIYKGEIAKVKQRSRKLRPAY